MALSSLMTLVRCNLDMLPHFFAVMKSGLTEFTGFLGTTPAASTELEVEVAIGALLELEGDVSGTAAVPRVSTAVRAPMPPVASLAW